MAITTLIRRSRRSADQWVAWQFDSPEKGRGLVQGIRLPASEEGTLTIHPKGIDPNATYVFENDETGETKRHRGKGFDSNWFHLRTAGT